MLSLRLTSPGTEIQVPNMWKISYIQSKLKLYAESIVLRDKNKNTSPSIFFVKNIIKIILLCNSTRNVSSVTFLKLFVTFTNKH